MNTKKILFIVAGILLVGAIGGTVASLLSRPMAKAASSKKEPAKEEEPTTTVQLDEFLLNLADTDEPHYLKATLALEIRGKSEGEGGGEKFKEITPRLRDAMISAMSGRRFHELLTPEGKQDLKRSLKIEANSVLGKNQVVEVYFTSFAMQ